MPLEEYSDLMEQEEALMVIQKWPFESASTINYININKDNPKMLKYKNYCLTLDVSVRVPEKEFNILERWITK